MKNILISVALTLYLVGAIFILAFNSKPDYNIYIKNGVATVVSSTGDKYVCPVDSISETIIKDNL